MSKEQEYIDSMLRFIRVAVRDYTIVEGTATNVDAMVNFTCDVIVDDGTDVATFPDVPLEVEIGKAASIIIEPEEGSAVLMMFRDGHKDRPQLLKVSSVKNVTINPTGKITLKLGANGGVPMVMPLTDHLNVIENDRNTLRDAISAWEPVPDDGGAALKLALAGWLGTEITPTQQQDLENPDIVQ